MRKRKKKLTKEIPEDLIKKAKLPVEGLTIDGNDIKINGVSLDNLSSSEQLNFGPIGTDPIDVRNFHGVCKSDPSHVFFEFIYLFGVVCPERHHLISGSADKLKL